MIGKVSCNVLKKYKVNNYIAHSIFSKQEKNGRNEEN